MRSLRFSICLAVWFWASPLFGQTPSLVISGGENPQIGFGNVTLHPPAYALQLDCKGGPAKFKLTGEPNFNPGPKLLPDGWWDCSGAFNVQFTYNAKPAELILAPATAPTTGSGAATTEKRLRLDFEPPPQPKFGPASTTPPTAGASDPWRPIALTALSVALLLAAFAVIALVLNLQTNRAFLQRDRGRREREDDWKNAIKEHDLRLIQLESRSKTENAQPIQAMAAAASVAGAVISNTSEQKQSQDVEDVLLRNLKIWCKRVPQCPDELNSKIQEYRKLLAKSINTSDNDGGGVSSQDLLQLAYSIAAWVTDYTDQYLDQQRIDPEWQALVLRILEAAKVEDIHPNRNDVFDDRKHRQVDNVATQSPEDLSRRVAWLVHRGYSTGGMVQRKASVVVFQ